MRSEDVGSSSGQNWLLSAARRVGIWRRPPLGALHELVVQSPDGRSRTFRSVLCLYHRLGLSQYKP